MDLTKQLTINVEGWPKYAVEILEKLVEAFEPGNLDKKPGEKVGELPLWPGVSAPLDVLRREEIFRVMTPAQV